MPETRIPTLCPWCATDAYHEADGCCHGCGFHRQCQICGETITDADAATLGNPETCGSPACRREWMMESNIDWADNLNHD